MERIERDHEIELVPKRQEANVGHFESKIGPNGETGVARNKVGHVL